MSKKTKTCADCGGRKQIDDFPRSAKAKDGRMKICRECHGARISAGASKAKPKKKPPAKKPKLRQESGSSPRPRPSRKKPAEKPAASAAAQPPAAGADQAPPPARPHRQQLVQQIAGLSQQLFGDVAQECAELVCLLCRQVPPDPEGPVWVHRLGEEIRPCLAGPIYTRFGTGEQPAAAGNGASSSSQAEDNGAGNVRPIDPAQYGEPDVAGRMPGERFDMGF